jgi:hypothetical protein
MTFWGRLISDVASRRHTHDILEIGEERRAVDMNSLDCLLERRGEETETYSGMNLNFGSRMMGGV